MTYKISKRKTSKRGGECNRNCTIRPGCSGNRWYNPDTKECEYDFQGIRKMVGNHSMNEWAEYKLLKQNPALIKIQKGYIPINSASAEDQEKYRYYIDNALGAKTGGKKKKSKRSKKKPRKSSRKLRKLH